MELGTDHPDCWCGGRIGSQWKKAQTEIGICRVNSIYREV